MAIDQERSLGREGELDHARRRPIRLLEHAQLARGELEDSNGARLVELARRAATKPVEDRLVAQVPGERHFRHAAAVDVVHRDEAAIGRPGVGGVLAPRGRADLDVAVVVAAQRHGGDGRHAHLRDALGSAAVQRHQPEVAVLEKGERLAVGREAQLRFFAAAVRERRVGADAADFVGDEVEERAVASPGEFAHLAGNDLLRFAASALRNPEAAAKERQPLAIGRPCW